MKGFTVSVLVISAVAGCAMSDVPPLEPCAVSASSGASAAPAPVSMSASAPPLAAAARIAVLPTAPRKPHRYLERLPAPIQDKLDAREKALAAALKASGSAGFLTFGGAAAVMTTASKWNPGHTVTVAFHGGSNATRAHVVEAARAWTSLSDATRHVHANVHLDFGDPGHYREGRRKR